MKTRVWVQVDEFEQDDGAVEIVNPTEVDAWYSILSLVRRERSEDGVDFYLKGPVNR